VAAAAAVSAAAAEKAAAEKAAAAAENAAAAAERRRQADLLTANSAATAEAAAAAVKAAATDLAAASAAAPAAVSAAVVSAAAGSGHGGGERVDRTSGGPLPRATRAGPLAGRGHPQPFFNYPRADAESSGLPSAPSSVFHHIWAQGLEVTRNVFSADNCVVMLDSSGYDELTEILDGPVRSGGGSAPPSTLPQPPTSTALRQSRSCFVCGTKGVEFVCPGLGGQCRIQASLCISCKQGFGPLREGIHHLG
jgi:hypothetical protein